MKKVLKLITKNAFVQGSFLLVASNFVVGFMNYLFNIFVGRALGPVGYSEIATLFSYLVIATIPFGVISLLLIQKLGDAQEPKKYAAMVHLWLMQKLQRYWYVVVLFFFITPALPSFTNLKPVVAYSLPILIFLSFFIAYYSGALQGLHEFLWYAGILVIATLIKLIGGIMVFANVGDLSTIIICIVFSFVFTVLLNELFLAKNIYHMFNAVRISSKRLRSFLRDTQMWLTIGTSGTMVLLNNVDIIYVKKVFDAEQAGIYGSWALFAKIILYVFGPLLTISYIFFANKKQQRYHVFTFVVSFVLLIVIGIGLYISYATFGNLLVNMLFGEKFAMVVPHMIWAALFGVGYITMSFMNGYFLARKSKVALIPTMLFPGYILGLLLYPHTVRQIMHVDTIFTFACIITFFLVFCKEQLIKREE
ncbi:hypothetical protein KC726_01795 [Candidatus Woesebacteria bacterium]|nr:hypothetical protein [Candidatus Woesebacteria bacterium]